MQSKKYQCEHGKIKYICVSNRFVFTIKLNINVNSAGHLNFVLMEEESQAVGIVGEEITVNTANKILLHRLRWISNMFSQQTEILM